MLSKITLLDYDDAKTILEKFSLDLAFCEYVNVAEDLGMKNFILRYNRIRDTLAMKSKTVKELAEVLDVNPKTVYKWCSNVTQPRINELYAIAAFLFVDPCELLN